MDLVPDRVVAQSIVEGEADVVREGLVGGVPPRREVRLDGAEIHGTPDDGVVVVQPEPLDVHRLVEPDAIPLLPKLGEDLRAPIQHRLPQPWRRPRVTRLLLLVVVLPRVDVGEEGADAAELAGEPRAYLPGLPTGQRRRADYNAPRRRGLRRGRG